MLFVLLVLKARAWLPFVSGDMEDYTLWLRHIVAFGRLRSLNGSFCSYSPPFVYVLAAASIFYSHLPAVILIKLTNLPFMVLGSAAAWSVARDLGGDRFRAGCAAAFLFLLPEVMENCWHWGQSDMLPTAMLLCMAALLVKARPYWAMALFGVAVAFKLQAILAAPALLVLLVIGWVPWASLPVAALSYLLMFVPAYLAGRPFSSASAVYTQQMAQFQSLSMDAPNPYVLVQMVTAQHETLLARLGIAVTTAVVLWFAWFARQRRAFRNRFGVMVVLTASLLFMPYLLPRMHERYFFAGDCFLAVLAVVRPRLAIPMALMQGAAVISYSFNLHRAMATNRQMLLPLALSTAAAVLFASELVVARLGYAAISGARPSRLSEAARTEQAA